MSDHVDGPRSIGDPAADISDLFAFTSPENPARTVLAMCVFPSAGEDAMFSNVGRLRDRRSPDDRWRRWRCRQVSAGGRRDPLQLPLSASCSAMPRDMCSQRGVCTLPGGRQLSLTVNDEKGASTPDGDFRVFAGLRSDPFYLAWIASSLTKVPNLLQHDNVLCIVVEFDTRRVLDPAKGSLFGAIAETVPIPQPPGRIGHPPARIDWIGRPEQTNVRLNNPGLSGVDDIRDLWNQQTPFAISTALQPLFLQRLKDSFADWDMRDGKADWTPEALAANANVFLDDFLLFDVAKPITDESHLEIEKSTIDGRPYQTGGGRTVDANSIDILLTWLVNHDREFLQGGATGATKPGMTMFPYLATPNSELQTVAKSVALDADPDEVWSAIGSFDLSWHPRVARVRLTGTGIGQLRTMETLDGREIVERLEAIDNAKRSMTYTNIAGIAASHYTGTLEVKPKGRGSVAEWRVQYLANGQPDIVVKTIVSALQKTGLESLTTRFGVPA